MRKTLLLTAASAFLMASTIAGAAPSFSEIKKDDAIKDPNKAEAALAKSESKAAQTSAHVAKKKAKTAQHQAKTAHKAAVKAADKAAKS